MYSGMENLDSTSASLGRRERKKLETRRTIRQAALTLALEEGVDKLTVEAITEAADVSPRTFFNYFACKEDALVTETAKIAAELHPLLAERPLDESPLHSLRVIFTDHDPLSLAGANRERSLARQKLVQDNPALMTRQLAQNSLMVTSMTELLAERFGVDPDEDLRPALLASITGGIIHVAVRRWSAGAPQSLVELIDAAFEHLERGDLTAPPQAASAD